MSKKIHCSKCGKLTEIYNRFSFTFAQKDYVFDGTINIDKFSLCHKDSKKLSSWLEASQIHMEYRLE